MTPVVEKLVAEVEALPEAPRYEVITALLRRTHTEPHDLPRNKDLVAAAEQSALPRASSRSRTRGCDSL